MSQEVAGFSHEHWSELSSRLRKTVGLNSKVHDAASLAASTVYEIEVWGNCYKVYASDEGPHPYPHPTPPDGRSCISNTALIPGIIREVYAAVQRERDEQARRAKADADEKSREAQRQGWASDERSKGAQVQSAVTAEVDKLLSKVKGCNDRCNAAVTEINKLTDTIRDIDNQANIINVELAKIAAGESRVIEQLKMTEDNLDRALSASGSNKTGENGDDSPVEFPSPLDDFHKKFNIFYYRLQNAKSRMEALRVERANSQIERDRVLGKIDKLKQSIQLEKTELILLLKSLRTVIDRLKDDSQPLKEWARLEAQATQYQNDISKTSVIIRSLECWHLNRFRQSPAKQQLASRAEVAGNAALGAQRKAFDFQRNLVLPPSVPHL